MRPREIDRRRAEHRRLRAAARQQHESSPHRAYARLRVSLRDWPDARPQLVEEELVAGYGFSRNSIRRALQMLAEDGLVSRAPRFGTVVAHRVLDLDLEPRTTAGGEPWVVETVRHVGEHLSAPGPQQARFAVVEELGRTDVPLFVRTRYQRLDGPADPTARGGHPDTVARSRVRAVACPAALARLLEIEPGSPLLIGTTVRSDAHGPVEIVHSAFRGDRVMLRA
ncbi:GntR family transcriptional regulator [Pseudonocardia sp. WMMC193]|uniref:GntR family transcriptional regulator n=1 Tax=Pseudonocardia sp. WMMC193 TaxID=2911965 RepID=UPI001F3408DA|nr:GntR family transcriptional regulator [Pseudonocardia sp. WMMC193]MCF7550003.1 GntR family transcriptional regulator [Pseudonocardia sp. WMMC193]